MLDDIKNIGIIGAGNVAWHMAKAFKENGLHVSHIYSKTPENRAALARMVNAKACDKLKEMEESVDFLLIAVNDDAIKPLSEELKNYKNLIAHTSGSVDLEVFKNFAHAGVFYPLQTFTKDIAINYSKIPFFIEARQNEDLKILKAIANKVSPYVFEANSKQRMDIHIASVFACNYVNYMYLIAQDILKQNNLPPQAIDSLIAETSRKVIGNDARKMQTGPARRNDIQTLNKHIKILQSNPQYANIYKLLADSINKTYNS